METHYIKELIKIYELSSFSKAAEELNLSQSSLSKHVQSLEKELGTALFTRTTRKIQLTSVGEELIQSFLDLDQLSDQILSKTNLALNQARNHINLISIPVMAQYNITKCITSFLQENKDFHISFNEIESKDIDFNLKQQVAELAFTRLIEPSDKDFDFISFYEDELIVVVPENHLMGKKKIIKIEEIAFQDFILLDSHTNLYQYFLNIIKMSNPKPNIVQTSHRPENIVDMVSQGLGITLLFKKQYEFTNKMNSHFINIENAPKSKIILKKIRNHKLSNAAAKFWDYVAKNYSCT